VTIIGSIQTHKKESAKLLTIMVVVQYTNQCVLKEGNIDTQSSYFSLKIFIYCVFNDAANNAECIIPVPNCTIINEQ
jgi:hypothetical protein